MHSATGADAPGRCAAAAGLRAALLLAAPALLAATPAARQDAPPVEVDARVELFALLQRLAGGEEYCQAPPCAALEALDRRFEPYREHEAVRMTARLRQESAISYDAPMSLAVHVDAVPSLALRVPLEPWPPGLDQRWRAASVPDYLEVVRDFARDSGFHESWPEHAAEHARAEAALQEALGAARPHAWLEQAFRGRPPTRSRIVIGTLCGQNNYGVRVELPGGLVEATQVLGVGRRDPSGAPLFGAWLPGLLLHEACHPYVNPAVDRFAARLQAPLSTLYEPVAQVMQRQAYGDWRTLGCESLVRGFVVLHARQVAGEEEAVRAAREQQMLGFHWTAELVVLLQRFHAQPQQHPDLDSFMPELAAFFEAMAQRPAEQRAKPFLGPVNAVHLLHRDPARAVVVMPPPGHVAGAYLARVHLRFYAPQRIPLLSPDALAPEEAAGRTLVLYGTPRSNPLLAEALRRLDWSIDTEGVRLGRREIRQENPTLIACHPSPFGGGLPVLVYAAAREQDLNGIQDLHHGPEDWLVAAATAEGRKRVTAGDFPKGLAGHWRPLEAEP